MAEAKQQMVELIDARGIDDPRILAALSRVPRHELVPPENRRLAYDDRPLPIGHGQTISQPYIVAFMTDAARLGPGDRVLEVGTGSGYQAAVLAELGVRVFSIEIVPALARQAAQSLARLGYDTVRVRQGDGYAGWPEEAPFDAIIVTAAPPAIPEPLKQQLASGGRLVIPVGASEMQHLEVYERQGEALVHQLSLPVRFVPMVGRAQDRVQ